MKGRSIEVRPTTNKKKEYDRERNNVKNEMTCAK